MTLTQIFKSLTSSEIDGDNAFAAVVVPGYRSVRVGTNTNGNPVILISTKQLNPLPPLKNYRFKHLTVEHGVACKITEGRKSLNAVLSVITFAASNAVLRDYFLKVAEALIQMLKDDPRPSDVSQCLTRFVEIFASLSNPPKKTVRGLWSELFLIAQSSKPEILLDYWHRIPEEKYDFNASTEKIEVKSTANFERVHYFSAEQLNPPELTQVLIASLYVKESLTGASILDLMASIAERVSMVPSILDKLHTVVLKTLGEGLEEGLKPTFDLTIAKSSLQFFMHQDVHRILKESIPGYVSGVRYKSDLSMIPKISIELLKPKGTLFSAL